LRWNVLIYKLYGLFQSISFTNFEYLYTILISGGKVVFMMRLPEKIRRALEKAVNELRIKENVYGIGLFGSWSRGEATASSDVDLFILDKSDFSYEYVERIEVGDLPIDLDHVPMQWIQGPIPPEVDQKLYEMQILYDRDWSLTNTKLLMSKYYKSAERVDIRTEAHVVGSDIYLSRATSAFSREDFRSACLFASLALENVLKVLVEVALEPFSSSHFVERFELSAKKVGMADLFDEYSSIAGLKGVSVEGVKEKLRLFKLIWEEMKVVVAKNPLAVESSHFKVKTKLNYYLNPAFLNGAVMRTNSLIDSEKAGEAAHYLSGILVDIVENYVWLKSSVDKVRVDYTTLVRSLESLEEKNPKNYENITRFLNLSKVEKSDASKIVERTREIMLKIRKDRKVLIKNHIQG
jgi:predicted nucleotidyltransferase